MKKAIIVGARGQDGQYLTEKLRGQNYSVIGLNKDSVENSDSSNIEPVDITQSTSVQECVKTQKPDEVYYLAAFHRSSEDSKGDDEAAFKESFEINVYGLTHFLDAIKQHSPLSRLFYAASSHIFGSSDELIQNEETPLRPDCIYGLTKASGLNVCRFYRNNRSVYASVGILYNHESPRRGPQFISQKIVQRMIAIKQGKESELVVGNLSASIDWGYAPDYTDAMHRILQLPQSDDFVIASGQTHTIRDFIEGVARLLDLDWQSFVKEDPSLIQKKPKGCLKGDHQKLTASTGWVPSVDLDGLIKIMVDDGLKTSMSDKSMTY